MFSFIFVKNWAAHPVHPQFRRHCIFNRAVGRSENLRVPVLFGGHNLPPPLVEIRLTHLPNLGVPRLPRHSQGRQAFGKYDKTSWSLLNIYLIRNHIFSKLSISWFELNQVDPVCPSRESRHRSYSFSYVTKIEHHIKVVLPKRRK